MPFKLADWQKMLRRLALAAEQLRQFTEDPTDRNLLDLAVFNVWTAAEYAINVLLELERMEKETWHRTDERARELKALGMLKQDYSKILQQLENYRLTAGYGSYVRNPSVHYSRKNVQDCLDAVVRLCDEVGGALQVAEKIS